MNRCSEQFLHPLYFDDLSQSPSHPALFTALLWALEDFWGLSWPNVHSLVKDPNHISYILGHWLKFYRIIRHPMVYRWKDK